MAMLSLVGRGTKRSSKAHGFTSSSEAAGLLDMQQNSASTVATHYGCQQLVLLRPL
jgi:hypothetical protein